MSSGLILEIRLVESKGKRMSNVGLSTGKLGRLGLTYKISFYELDYSAAGPAGTFALEMFHESHELHEIFED